MQVQENYTNNKNTYVTDYPDEKEKNKSIYRRFEVGIAVYSLWNNSTSSSESYSVIR